MRRVRSGDSVGVTAFGRGWLLRRTVAWDWVTACTGPELAGVFPGLVRDSDVTAVWDVVLGEPDCDRRCANVARVALSRASGREWWWAYNMIVEARKSWVHLNGKLMLAGVSCHEVALSDWLDAAYIQMVELLDKDAGAQLDGRLRRIPTSGVSARPKMSTRTDLLAFARE